MDYLQSIFGSLLQDLPAKIYSEESIYNIEKDNDKNNSQNGSFDQKQFLVDLFELNKSIDPRYWTFISKLLEHEVELTSSTKIWKHISPYLMRFFIHYNYQFVINLQQFLQTPTLDNPIFTNARLIIPIVYLFSPNQNEFDNILRCLSEFSDQLKNILYTPDKYFEHEILRSFTNEIFTSCYSILVSIERITQKYSILVELCFLYFNSHCLIFGIEELSILEIGFLIQTLNLIPKIDIFFIQSNPQNYIIPLLDGAMQVLRVFNNYHISDALNDKSFLLGISIITTLTFLIKIDLHHEFQFLENYAKSFADIGYFILWGIDRFPFIFNTDDDFPFNLENQKLIIPNDIEQNIKIPIIPDYNFIESPTFSNQVKTVSQMNEENLEMNDYQYQLTSFEFPDIILQNKELNILAGSIIHFIHVLSDHSQISVKNLIEKILEIISFLFDSPHEESLSQLFDIKRHHLHVSYLFFIITIFHKCNSSTICAVLTRIPNSFYIIFQSIVFTPHINKWIVLDNTDKRNNYFAFIFQLRTALIHFLSTCFRISSNPSKYTNSSSSSNENILESSEKTSSYQLFKRKAHKSSSHSSIIKPISNSDQLSFNRFNNSLQVITDHSFTVDFDQDKSAFLVMAVLYKLFVDSAPYIFDEIIPLFMDFIIVDVDFFIRSANCAGIFEMLMKHMLDLQVLHICLANEKNKQYQIYSKNVEQSRLALFGFFDQFLKTNDGKVYFFGSQPFVQFIFHFLFEPPLMYFVSDLIVRCVMLNADSICNDSQTNQFKIIFRNLSDLIKIAIGNIGDIRWIRLMLVLLETLKDGFAINRNSIFQYLKSQQILLLLSRLPMEVVRANPTHFVLYENHIPESIEEYTSQISEEDRPYMQIFEVVFDIFINLSRENATFAKSLASSPDSYYDNITAGLKLIIFGPSIIDRLLSLVFEQPISIKKLPSTGQIRNYFALPFLFTSTTHLAFHPILMHFLIVVCSESVSNKLRVFQANLPEIIIDYLQNFPKQNEHKIINESIAECLHLFSIVSQYVFSVPTLFKCIQAMRLKEGQRVWWTGELLSLFSTYIENSAKSSPCAFFYLDGRHTGFFLPEISQSTFSKGWSFMCRFELDSLGSSNIGRLSPVLLYMKLKNGDSFSISMKNSQDTTKQGSKLIQISYTQNTRVATKGIIRNNLNPNNKSWSEVIEQYEIQSNQWYNLIFSSDFKIYISANDSGEMYEYSVKNSKKVDLRQGVESTGIGNTPPRTASEAPLVANISSFYFFTGTINSETARLLLSLPLSFVFGFSPSELKLDTRLPHLLFTDEFDSRLYLGFNARMTDGSKSFNISKKRDISYCTFRGVSFPFSTSFVDITYYSGGVKLFLPLFDQINLPMYNEPSRKDNSAFFQQLISIILSFFQRSKSLEDDFVRSDGFKAVSFSLMKIQPQYFTKTVICSLLQLCKILEPEFRSIMIDEIWLNFNIWKRLPVSIQLYIYETIFSDLKNSENFRDHLRIGELCAVIAEQPSKELRNHLWRLLSWMATVSFTHEEQDSLFSFLFVKDNVEFQLEALQCFYELCVFNINDCISVFQRRRMFLPFLQLLLSPHEKVWIISLRIIFLIYHSFPQSLNSSVTYLNVYSADQFDLIILGTVHQLITNDHIEEITNETWKLIQYIAFGNEMQSISTDLRFILPIACSCSHFFDSEKLSHFHANLNYLVSISSSTASISITNCRLWYFWLFYFTFQTCEGPYNFSDRSDDAQLFGKLFKVMALKDRIDEPLFFFEWICYTRGWNTMPFINMILNETLTSFEKLEIPQFLNIVFEVFFFMFYINSNERYSSNVQLYSEHSQTITDTLLNEIESRLLLKTFISFNDTLNSSDSTFSFSMRVTENGEWKDLDLAKKLIVFISSYYAKTVITPSLFKKIPNTRLSEIFCYLIYCTLRFDQSITNLELMLSYIKVFFKQKALDSMSMKIITTAFAILSLKDLKEKTEIIDLLNQFYKKNSTLMNNQKSDFGSVSYCRLVLQDNGPDISFWLESLQTFSSSALDIYKQRWQTYVPVIESTIQKINKKLVNVSYTDEMEENITYLKRNQRRNTMLAAKVSRRFQRALIVNGGPWCADQVLKHWKLAPRTDFHMRHILTKPNWKFDIHKGASLLRDQSKNIQAKLEYQRWIEMQDDQPSNEFSTDQEDIQDLRPARLQYQFSATMITLSAVYEGTFSLDKNEICFDGLQVRDEYLFSIEGNSSKTVEFKLSDVIWVLHRSYLHIDRGLEFFCNDGRSYFFYFSLSDRNQILKLLSDYRPPNLAILQRTSSAKCFMEQRFTEKWLNHEISTYDYLMIINLFAGRSFHDLSQYPVFPWVLADYTSETIDVHQNPPPPGLFRDLSKPIGALNEKRLAKLKIELEENQEQTSLIERPCLYRCHYSTAYYVLLYMIRLEPFTTMHILMQDNKFDHPNRLFSGIDKSWKTVTSTANDYRELIPEFFTLPHFLKNSDDFDLGLSKEDGNDVILPNWAKNEYDFISKHKEALESEYVSQNIGYWIDLLFGFKQNGQAAIDANNTFHAYCYPSIIDDPEVKTDHELLYEIQKHAGSFGIVPRQLFTTLHPNRQPRNDTNSKEIAFYNLYTANADILSLTTSAHLYIVTSDSNLVKFKPKQRIVESLIPIPFGVGKCTIVFAKLKLLAVTSPSGDGFLMFSIDSNSSLSHVFSFRQQFSSLTSIVKGGDSTLIVLSQDGSLTVWDFGRMKESSRSQRQTSSPLINSAVNTGSKRQRTNSFTTTSSNESGYVHEECQSILFSEDGINIYDQYFYLPASIVSSTSSQSPISNERKGQNYYSSNNLLTTNEFYNNNSYTSNNDPIYTINHHFLPAVAADANEALRLIVSCDVSRRIVLTEMINGSFIRSFILHDESAIPVNVMILEAGYIVTFCEHRSHNDIRSTIQINALDSTMLSIYDHPRRVTASCPINLKNGLSYVAVAFEDGNFVILESPNAVVKYTTLFSSSIVSLSFNVEENIMYLANSDKQIITFSLVLDM